MVTVGDAFARGVRGRRLGDLPALCSGGVSAALARDIRLRAVLCVLFAIRRRYAI